jgi:hypothetical protein
MFEKFEKLQLIATSLIIAVAIVVAANVITGAISKDSVVVTGSYAKTVTSDSGQVVFEINSRQLTKVQAYDVINKQRPEIIKFLEGKGVKKENIEIRTPNGYNVYKVLPNGNSSNDFAYYTISQTFVVKSSDVNLIKEIAASLPDLNSKGIDINVFDPNYYYSKLSEIKVTMLEEATKDAKQRADAMLKATHNKVGKIQSVKMGVFQITPVDSNEVSDMGISDTSSIEKKITSVANVTFSVK